MYALSSSQSGPFYAWDRRGVSFIGRHWRGGYSLAVAYWLFGLLVGLASGLVGAGMEWLANGIEYNPLHILLAAMLGWAVLILLSGWHLVGVWRSANRWRASGRAGFWGWAARLVTVAGFTQFAVVMGQVALPQFVALADIVVNGDSTIPDYTITVTDGGSDVEITGGFKYGLADALRRVLDAAPGVRVLALQSPGGRIGEARAVYRLIVDRRLNTVTNTYCMSACTYAFLGGSRRWLGVGARLGFHAGHFVGMSQAVVARQQRGFFAEVTARDGVPPAFSPMPTASHRRRCGIRRAANCWPTTCSPTRSRVRPARCGCSRRRYGRPPSRSTKGCPSRSTGRPRWCGRPPAASRSPTCIGSPA
jgi:hypothetical protein